MRIIFFALILAPLVLMSCSNAQEKQTQKNPSQKQEQAVSNTIDFENAVFVDVRTPGEFQEGSFEDAVNIPLNVLSDRLNELDKDEQIIVFCRSGARASRAMDLLKSNGYKNVINGINTSNLNSLKEK